MQLHFCNHPQLPLLQAMTAHRPDQHLCTQAMEAEEEVISSGLPALEEQERRQSAPAELLLDGGSIANFSPTQTSSTPADPAAAASPSDGGASAGGPEQTHSQVRDQSLLFKC